jgi:molybdopterin synthase catalytic subunit
MVKLMDLIEKIKRDSDHAKVGMIACHNGLVRATSRDGRAAEYLDIDVNPVAWETVLKEMRSRPGIAAIEAFLFTGRREIGEDVLLVAVAGDIRENVFPVLEETVNRMKREAILKNEKLTAIV